MTENHPFLRHLKGPKQDIPNDSLCTIWASRLLSHVQARLDSASLLADRICVAASQITSASVSPSLPNNTSGQCTEELSRQVAALRATPARRRTHLSDHCCNTPSNSPTRHDICWYHRRFAHEAQKCNPSASISRETPPAVISGDKRLHHQFMPPPSERTSSQTAVCCGHWT